jgi:hypothetical protein
MEPAVYGIVFTLIIGSYLYFHCKDSILLCIVMLSFAYLYAINQEIRRHQLLWGVFYIIVIILFKTYKTPQTVENAYAFLKEKTLNLLMFFNLFLGARLFFEIAEIDKASRIFPLSFLTMWTMFLWIIFINNIFTICLEFPNIKKIYSE